MRRLNSRGLPLMYFRVTGDACSSSCTPHQKVHGLVRKFGSSRPDGIIEAFVQSPLDLMRYDQTAGTINQHHGWMPGNIASWYHHTSSQRDTHLSLSFPYIEPCFRRGFERRHMFETLTQPPDPYILLLMGLGLLIALVAWLPLALRRLPLSLPIVCIGLGMGLGAIPGLRCYPSPLEHPEIAERFAEFVVIIALMGAGLKIDRVLGLRSWMITWRLIFLTLPLGIALIAVLAGAWLALPWAMALLLGAVLAPTDPVLASDVQVGPPKTGEEDEIRFALTSEAGVNDGAAFPFVHLAIALAAASVTNEAWVLDWLTYNVVWEIGVGILGGYLVGRLFGWITFHIPAESKLAKTGDGLIALSATFVSYGLTEVIHSYGFLSVFVTALAFRQSHRDHDFHKSMHDLIEQIERISMMLLLLLFGGCDRQRAAVPAGTHGYRGCPGDPAGHPAGHGPDGDDGHCGTMARENDDRILRHPGHRVVLLPCLWSEPH